MPTVIGVVASQSPPSQKPLQTSGSIVRAGAAASNTRLHVPVVASNAPAESQISPGTSPENVPVHASTRYENEDAFAGEPPDRLSIQHQPDEIAVVVAVVREVLRGTRVERAGQGQFEHAELPAGSRELDGEVVRLQFGIGEHAIGSGVDQDVDLERLGDVVHAPGLDADSIGSAGAFGSARKSSQLMPANASIPWQSLGLPSSVAPVNERAPTATMSSSPWLSAASVAPRRYRSA